MENEIINNYIDLIDKVNSKLTLSENLKEFIKSYDGSNEEEFQLLVASAVGAMTKYEEAKIKANGYDRVVEASDDFNEWFSGIKNEYAMLEKGIMPIEPPAISGSYKEDEDTTEEIESESEGSSGIEDNLEEEAEADKGITDFIS